MTAVSSFSLIRKNYRQVENAQKLEPKETVFWYNNKDDLELPKKV